MSPEERKNFKKNVPYSVAVTKISTTKTETMCLSRQHIYVMYPTPAEPYIPILFACLHEPD